MNLIHLALLVFAGIGIFRTLEEVDSTFFTLMVGGIAIVLIIGS